ncbi:MAG: hypothetical protein ACT4PX_10285 [Actinomycetota bacterium]
MPQPPPGFKATQPQKVNLATCDVIAGPTQFAPLAAEDEQTVGGASLPSVSVGGGESSALSSCGQMHTRSVVKDNDKANIPINEVNTDTDWCWDGSIVTSYNSGGTYSWHREFPSGGWSPENAFNLLSDGCAGCDHARFHAHVDFSYQGVFDPTGDRYYNHLNNWPRVNNDGTWSCELFVDFKNKPNNVPLIVSWFNWYPSCY